ncbi:hypothetical protein EVAR_22784_1 [Eumeta japonica]|uniref:Uncharacterized protein n=1 Tax=Eumeta variegata TaxID=151549 RepID=A0A4C1VHV2_EUMVA|nr:hypothetical protein EVAR_22784_1 [Eumeta japonica]
MADASPQLPPNGALRVRRRALCGAAKRAPYARRVVDHYNMALPSIDKRSRCETIVAGIHQSQPPSAYLAATL